MEKLSPKKHLRKKSSRILLFCLLFCSLLLAACGQNSFDKIEKTTIESEAGFQFVVPSDWQQLTVTDDYTQYQFVNPDNSISLLVLAELGGVEYNSLEEIGTMVAENLTDSLFAEGAEAEKASTGEGYFRQLIRGTDINGEKSVAVVNIWHPYTGIRFYMLFVCQADAYKENAAILSGIESSFSVLLSAEEMYQYVQNLRDSAAESSIEGSGNSTDQEANSSDDTEPEITPPTDEGSTMQ